MYELGERTSRTRSDRMDSWYRHTVVSAAMRELLLISDGASQVAGRAAACMPILQSTGDKMIDGKEIRWFCSSCLEDQTTNVWDHYDKVTHVAQCPTCTTKIAQGGQDADRSDTTRHDDSNQLPRNTGADKAGV